MDSTQVVFQRKSKFIGIKTESKKRSTCSIRHRNIVTSFEIDHCTVICFRYQKKEILPKMYPLQVVLVVVISSHK